MAKERNLRGVARDPTVALDDPGATLGDGVLQLAIPAVSVDAKAKRIAGLDILLACRSHGMPWDFRADGGPLHASQMFAYLEAESRIKRERAAMIARLHQPDAGKALVIGALHHRFHQPPADAVILHVRVDRDRTDTGDGAALIQKIAAGDLAFDLGHDAVETWMSRHHGE